MTLRVKELPTVIPQINKAMVYMYIYWVFLPVSLTFVLHVELLLLCHQLSVMLSDILKLQHLSKMMVTVCIQGVIRSHSRIDPKSQAHNHDPLLAGQPSLHPAEFFASCLSIKAERERAAGC